MSEQINTPRSLASSAQTQDLSCCKIAPTDTAPTQNPLLSGGAGSSTPAIRATNDLARDLPSAVLLIGRGSPRSAKLQHSPVHALLCTFLV